MRTEKQSITDAKAQLEMVLSGHGATEPATADALVRATDAFADRITGAVHT